MQVIFKPTTSFKSTLNGYEQSTLINLIDGKEAYIDDDEFDGDSATHYDLHFDFGDNMRITMYSVESKYCLEIPE